jgi:hypothetical protein
VERPSGRIPAAAPRRSASAGPWWKLRPLSVLELADPLHVAAHGRDGFDPARIVRLMR